MVKFFIVTCGLEVSLDFLVQLFSFIPVDQVLFIRNLGTFLFGFSLGRVSLSPYVIGRSIITYFAFYEIIGSIKSFGAFQMTAIYFCIPAFTFLLSNGLILFVLPFLFYKCLVGCFLFSLCDILVMGKGSKFRLKDRTEPIFTEIKTTALILVLCSAKPSVISGIFKIGMVPFTSFFLFAGLGSLLMQYGLFLCYRHYKPHELLMMRLLDLIFASAFQFFLY